MSVEELELLRKKARNSVLIGICITIVLALVLYQLTTVPQLIILSVVFGIIFTIIISNKPIKDFKDNFIFDFKFLFSLFVLLFYSSNNFKISSSFFKLSPTNSKAFFFPFVTAANATSLSFLKLKLAYFNIIGLLDTAAKTTSLSSLNLSLA